MSYIHRRTQKGQRNAETCARINERELAICTTMWREWVQQRHAKAFWHTMRLKQGILHRKFHRQSLRKSAMATCHALPLGHHRCPMRAAARIYRMPTRIIPDENSKCFTVRRLGFATSLIKQSQEMCALSNPCTDCNRQTSVAEVLSRPQLKSPHDSLQINIKSGRISHGRYRSYHLKD